jgi:hypothetical protein
MRIAGLDAKQAVTGIVVIPRGEDGNGNKNPPLTLTVQGLPLGSEAKLARMFPPPNPPLMPVQANPNKPGGLG